MMVNKVVYYDLRQGGDHAIRSVYLSVIRPVCHKAYGMCVIAQED